MGAHVRVWERFAGACPEVVPTPCGAQADEALVIRVLPPEEWHRVEPLVVDRREWLPSPEVARILVSEDAQGEIEGFIVIQLVAHIEPIWVHPQQRGTGLWKELVASAQEQFPPGVNYYAFTPSPALERMAEQSGLTKLPWSIFRGQR